MYSPARREAEIIPFPSSGKTNKVSAPSARPRGRKRAEEPAGKVFVFAQEKTRSADLLVFVFFFAQDGWKNVEKLR
jgi:hypothetical protein